jgi:hypothetical protein
MKTASLNISKTDQTKNYNNSTLTIDDHQPLQKETPEAVSVVDLTNIHRPVPADDESANANNYNNYKLDKTLPTNSFKNSKKSLANSESNTENSYKNLFFTKINNAVKPLAHKIKSGNTPLIISTVGAIMHITDSFVEKSSAGADVKKLSYLTSTWFSKLFSHLPNSITGFEELENNNFVHGMAKLFNFTKLKQSEPINFGFSTGMYPATFMETQKIGEAEFKNKKFTSFGDNVSYFFKNSLKANKQIIKDLKQGEQPFKNSLRLLVPPVAGISSLLGTIFVGNQVNTLVAKIFGVMRNLSGIGGDMLMLKNAESELKAKKGDKYQLKDLISHPEAQIGIPFIFTATADIFNRCFNSADKIKPVSQAITGINEMIMTRLNAYANKQVEPA